MWQHCDFISIHMDEINHELNRQISSIYLMRSGVANVYPKYIECIDFFRIGSCTSMSGTADVLYRFDIV